MTSEASASTSPTARATAATRRSGRNVVRLRAPVRQRGHMRAYARKALVVALGADNALPVRRLGEHRAPGLNDHRAAIGRHACGQLSILGGRDDEALVLDRACTQQHF